MLFHGQGFGCSGPYPGNTVKKVGTYPWWHTSPSQGTDGLTFTKVNFCIGNPPTGMFLEGRRKQENLEPVNHNKLPTLPTIPPPGWTGFLKWTEYPSIQIQILFFVNTALWKLSNPLWKPGLFNYLNVPQSSHVVGKSSAIYNPFSNNSENLIQTKLFSLYLSSFFVDAC